MIQRRFARLLVPLILVGAFLAPAARADELADLLSRLETAGARVVRVSPDDARLLGEGRVTTGIGPDGRVEVYLPEGGTPVRTPLRTPTARMTIEEYRTLTGEIRTAVRELYGIEIERVYIAGSSSGIPFNAPDGELRTFDRKGHMTSDYDGALVSRELYDLVRAENPRAIRGTNTGMRTSPDPLPALRERLALISQRYGRHVAGMIYASEAEHSKRMAMFDYEIGRHTMPEPGPGATHVEVTRAELLGALIEAEQLRRLVGARGAEGAGELLRLAREGNVEAVEELRTLRRAAVSTVRGGTAGLTEADVGHLTNEALRLEPPSNFALGRGGPRGPPPPLAMAEGDLRALFGELREGALALASERAGALSGRDRLEVLRGAERIGDARLEIVSSSERIAEFLPETTSVRVSTALVNELGEAGSGFRTRALALILGHELAHAGGLRAEAVADAEAVRIAERAGQRLAARDARRVVEMFARGEGRLADAVHALRVLPRYGTTGSRTANMVRAIEGQPDPLARYRRVDGTLRWGRLSAERALSTAGGAAHFALSLFLKELAVVVQTGDRARIEEFFDGLMTTDFFVTYGLFSAGAQVGNVAYSRFLARHIRPRFVSGVLRTNIVLATGLALPQLVHGELDGRAFAIDVGALGLSSVAVKAGLEGISWVVNLRRLEGAAAASRWAARLRPLARAGGWLFTAAETAVVLYFGDEIAQAVNRWIDDRAARSEVAGATEALAAAAAGDDDAEFARRLVAFDDLHLAYRDHLYRPLTEAESIYTARMERLAREAKLAHDRRLATLERLERFPALAADILRRHHTLEAYAEHLTAEANADLSERLATVMESFEAARARGLAQVYAEGRRGDAEGYLPSGTLRRDRGLFARLSGSWEARDLSANRLEAYEDQHRALELVRAQVAGDPRRSALVDEVLARTREIARRDRALFLGAGETRPTPAGVGAAGALEEALRED
jgi:hypothetical protein